MHRFFVISGMIVVLSACNSQKEYHGNLLSTQDVKNLKVGSSSQEQVLKTCGVPSCVFAFDPQTWYYLSQITDKKALCTPQVKQVLCYTMIFNATGVLETIYKSDKLVPVPLYAGAIALPSSHRDTFLQQLLRNVRRDPGFFKIK